MSLFALRELALAGSIVAGLTGAWAASAVAQQKTIPPIFSPNPSVGWIGIGEFQPVSGQVPPLKQDSRYPFVPNNN